ncbi:MAG: hypothetical protein ACRC8S_15985 [Fimbriiglobus sp.]
MWNSFPLPNAEPFVLPNHDLLRKAGWKIKTINGAYCVAWRENEEVVFCWKNGEWHHLTGRFSPVSAAA